MSPVDWQKIRRNLAAAERLRRDGRAATPGQRKAMLRARARELARQQPAAAAEDRLELLVFQLAWEDYAVEMRHVREVYPLQALTPLPCTPPFLLGLINLRGELRPVVDLKRLLAMPERGLANSTRAIILNHDARELGIVADVIIGVCTIDAATVQPPPADLRGGGFLHGVTSDRLIILDVRRLLAHPGLIVNEEVET